MSKASSTRLLLLQKAFELIYAKGYQATSIDDIIAKTKVTKGAFYYHFKNKDDMGLAVIQEILYAGMHQALITPLIQSKQPITDLYRMMHTLLLEDSFFRVKYGCPAINLIEELGGSHPVFRKALAKLVTEWQRAIQQSIEQGQKNGSIRKNVNAKQVALFLTTGYGGVRNLGKLFGSACYTTYLKELKGYLKTLT